jgi:MFS family permease
MGFARRSAGVFAIALRNPDLRRAQAAFGLVWAGEWAATVAVSVIAFRHGGAAAVGLVSVVRMVPAALVAPVAATVSDRMRRDRVLAGVAVTRAVTLALAGLLAAAGDPVALIYVALAAATVAQTLFRPTHSALLPTLCTTPAELTSANVVRGLLDSIATLVGPAAAAVLLAVSGPAAVLFAAAGGAGLAAILVAALRYEQPPRLTQRREIGPAAAVIEGLRAIAADRSIALLTALATVQTFVRGALTVFSVAIAIELLHSGNAGVGILTAAVGVGAIAGSMSAARFVGHGSLARWFGVGVALWGAPLIVIGAFTHLGVVLVMLAIVGLGNALVDVGVFTLIARLADDAVLARVFAAFEGIITLGVAVGAIVTPALISAFGVRTALVIVGVGAPAAVFVSWAGLRRIDRRIYVRDSDIALLQQVPMLRVLPQATIEQLASRAVRIEVPEAASVFEQGDEGQRFYVIEAGQAVVVHDGRQIRVMTSGDGFGEIALIRECARTATVRAGTPLTLRALDRNVFVAAMTGYTPSTQSVDEVITKYLAVTPGAAS